MNKIFKKTLGIIVPFLPVVFGGLIVAFIIFAKTNNVFEEGKTTIITSSTLTEAIDIAELSTAQYTYNGIAEIYEDDDKEDVECYIKYNAKVKAGIEMKDVQFDIDDESKTVTPILPEIQITSNTVDDKNLSFIPEDSDIEIKEALVACEEDALNESKKSPELVNSAKENLKSIIEALIDPIIKPNGYKIKWD